MRQARNVLAKRNYKKNVFQSTIINIKGSNG